MSTTTAPEKIRRTWHVDPQHVEVGFAVRHLMISTVKGHFRAVTGVVRTEADDFTAAEVELTIEARSLETRDEARDAHLRSADFFDVDQYPTLTFKSRRVTAPTKHHYVVVGDLTIHGVTREVSLDVVAEGVARDPWGNEKAGFHATGSINRKDFGLVWNVALETGGVLVGDEVKLNLDIELTRQKDE